MFVSFGCKKFQEVSSTGALNVLGDGVSGTFTGSFEGEKTLQFSNAERCR